MPQIGIKNITGNICISHNLKIKHANTYKIGDYLIRHASHSHNVSITFSSVKYFKPRGNKNKVTRMRKATDKIASDHNPAQGQIFNPV